MNKYINRTGVSSPSKTPHNQYNKHIYLQIENNSAPQIGRLTIPTSQNNLESQMPSAQSLNNSYSKNYSYPLSGKKAELNTLQEKKMYHWRQKKRLIIEDSENQLRKNSLSITLEKRKPELSQNKQLKSFSSQKKTPIKQAFQVLNPPKLVSKMQKTREDDSKCEMIKNILQKFKKQIIPEQQSSQCNSPCISSLKLKDRTLQKPNLNSRQTQNIKFLGKRGCPLSKVSKHYLQKRQKKENKPSHFVQTPLRYPQEISPWHTEQF